MWSHISRAGIAVVAGCAVLGISLMASPAMAAQTRTPTAAEMIAFFDEAVPKRLGADHVPGAVVSVVSGSDTASKGYGLADLEHHTPFDPRTSLVRIASISKLFTFTAVMQQVEQGKLDLHQDVNRYLSAFKVPATFPQPITLQDLMDHTAGFEDRQMGIGSATAADVPPLGTFLAEHMPARIRPPGEITAYSNYGAALAGYIVSQVSGQPYDQYVRDHILNPLGMTHSTATEPVPAALAPAMARSYDYENGTYQRKPFVFDNLVPDGSVSATADDMTRFMSAHLHDGTGILNPSTAKLMHERSFAPDPRIDGYAHGFKEQTFNGHRVIMHDGGWEGFESVLILVPDADLGLFFAINGAGTADTLAEVFPAFIDRFLPGTRGAPAQASGPAPVEGFYRPTHSAETNIEKLLTLTNSGRLRVDGGKVAFAGKTWAPLGPGLYQQEGGMQRLAIVNGKSGGDYAVTDVSAYERIGFLDTPQVNLLLIAAFAIVALTFALGLPLAAVVRRLRRRPSAAPRAWRTARLLAALGGVSGIAFVVLLTLALLGSTSILYGAPMSIRLLLLIPPVFLALTAASAAFTVAAWRQKGAGVLARTHQVVVLVTMFGLAWFCLHWNLIGWQFG
ncbi:beta-lactamase family protein [Streptosporangiaceae bacterium NEAU-GS5]|nr:beta-lactamase family protein [Streptosporangiaceae bacterium NEAU-GS5]